MVKASRNGVWVRARSRTRGSGLAGGRLPDAGLDIGDDRFGFGRTPMRHQPARRFRQPHPHHEDNKAEHRTDQEGKPPAQLGVDHRRIEQHDRADRADGGADPEAAVDHEIGPAAHARRDQLLDGGVDGGIFATDAGAGEEAEQHEAPQVPRHRGGGGGEQIDRQRDEEQLLAAEPVGQPAEEQRAQHCARQIGAAGEPDIGIAELQHRALLERARQRARPG